MLLRTKSKEKYDIIDLEDEKTKELSLLLLFLLYGRLLIIFRERNRRIFYGKVVFFSLFACPMSFFSFLEDAPVTRLTKRFDPAIISFLKRKNETESLEKGNNMTSTTLREGGARLHISFVYIVEKKP